MYQMPRVSQGCGIYHKRKGNMQKPKMKILDDMNKGSKLSKFCKSKRTITRSQRLVGKTYYQDDVNK